MLRKANYLSNKKQGRHAGYGLALESVLREQLPEDIEIPANDGINGDEGSVSGNGKPTGGSPRKRDNDVFDRDQIKNKSYKEQAKHDRKNQSLSRPAGATADEEVVENKKE